MAKRVLMIGLDGASPALIQKWKDDLPHLSRLMAEGAWGVLRSTMPPATLPAWPSMITGVNPGKLGIFGFRRRLPGSYRIGFNSLADTPVPTAWDILGQEGHTCGIIGFPSTFPPQPLNGFMVSGFPAPANDGRLVFTYPGELSRELDERFGGYELAAYESYQPGQEEAFITTWKRVARLHGKAAAWLAETRPWEFLAVIFLTIDRISHHFWRFIDPTHPGYDLDAAARWGDVIRDFYRLEDENVGRLLNLVDENDLILVTSDHGFCGRHRIFFLNEWLRHKGYLHLTGPVVQRRWLGRCVSPLVRLYQRRTWVRTLLAPFRRTTWRDHLMAAHHAHRFGRTRLEGSPVDWSRTTAYALDQHRLYLNLQGREPQGIVPLDAYDKLLSQLEQDLRNLTDEAGQRLPVATYRGREVYRGRFVHEAPDLLVFMDDYRCDVGGGLGGGHLFEPSLRLSGAHHPDGLLMIRGDGVRAGHRLTADITDIAPTILHALGAPVPAECDGQPIHQAFEEHADFRRRPVRRESSADRDREQHVWSEEEESQILDRLRDLGYV